MTACAVVLFSMMFIAVPDPGFWGRLVWGVLLVAVMGGSLWLRRRDRLAYERALAEAAAARAVAEDRLAIARELHDIVSGGLGAITVRAAVAQRLEAGPEGLRAALADVESASREATDGLRRMLGVLRGQDMAGMRTPAAAPEAARPAPTTPDPGPDGRPAAVPAPKEPAALADPTGLRAGIDGAVRQARRNGLTVDASWQEEPRTAHRVGPRGTAVPPALREAAVRLVAEALANTTRHAGPTRAHLGVRHEPGWLRIAVVDDGPADDWAPRPGAGQGLRGMRERVEALGGWVSAGKRRDAPGFAVEAALPLPTGAPARPVPPPGRTPRPLSGAPAQHPAPPRERTSPLPNPGGSR